MGSYHIELDGDTGRLFLHGSCLQLLPICKGFCCRVYKVIAITPEEYQAGLYAAEVICTLTEKECVKEDACRYKRYQLIKNLDGSCIYQDSDKKCSIHDHKPRVCADFSCQGGWELRSVLPPEGRHRSTSIKLDKDAFIQRIADDMTFVLHPLVKLHTIFYLQARGQVIFVKETVGGCGKFSTRDDLHFPQLNDALLLALADAFSNKDSLGDVYQDYCDQHGAILTKQEFYEIVWLFNRHSIILSATNFRGMLGGTSAI